MTGVQIAVLAWIAAATIGIIGGMNGWNPVLAGLLVFWPFLLGFLSLVAWFALTFWYSIGPNTYENWKKLQELNPGDDD